MTQRRDRPARCALLDVQRQIEQRPRRVVLDVAEFLRPDRADRIEGIVIGLRRVDLGAHRRESPSRRRAGCAAWDRPSTSSGIGRPEQFEQRGHQVDAAEQVVVDAAARLPARRRPHDHRDAGARVVQRRLGARQGRAVVGEEHHPGVAVQAGLGQGVEQLADRGVGDGDRAVEVGEVLPHVGDVGQVVGQVDGVGVGGFVAVARVGPVRLEEAGGQQERLLPAHRRSHWVAVLDDVLAVRVRHVELVEARARRDTTSRAACRKVLCANRIRTADAAGSGRRRGTPSRGGPARPARCSAGSGR